MSLICDDIVLMGGRRSIYVYIVGSHVDEIGSYKARAAKSASTVFGSSSIGREEGEDSEGEELHVDWI